MLLEISRKLRPVSGYGGISVVQSPDSFTESDYSPIVYKWAQRLPGLEMDDVTSHCIWLRQGRQGRPGIKGVNWLTVIGEAFVEEMGGRDRIEADLAALDGRLDVIPSPPMKRRITPAALGALLALGTFATLTVAAPALAAPGVPCSFYGLSPGATLDDATLEGIAAAGAGSVRIELRGGAAGWDDATLAAYDAVVDAARAAGLEPVGLLATGVAPGGQAAWNDDADGDGYNPYVEDFATTSAALVDRFAGKISRWEIWTGPNCWTNPDYLLDPQAAGCTYVLPRVFATMLAEAYRRNRALVDVGAVSFTSGGLLTDDSGPFFSAEDYLDELYAEPAWDALEGDTGRRYPWDRIGYQLYVDQVVPTDGALAATYLDAITAVAATRADTAFISITEVGWSSMLVGEDIQAENLSAAFDLLASRPDVADASWSSYRDLPAADGTFGLVTETGASKPALAAFQGAAEGCEAAGGEGEGGGGGSSGGNGPSGGAPVTGGSGTAPPLGGPRSESSCSCTAAGADRGGRGHTAAMLVLCAASAIWAARAGRRRGRRRADGGGFSTAR